MSTAQLATRTPETDDFVILAPYAENGVAPLESQSRITTIATISAGSKTPDGKIIRPDGRIYVHGDAPGLRAILEKNANKSLTVMFPSDRPRDFIQQRFAEYSQSALKAYGDEKQITVLDGKSRETYLAGSPQYKTAIARCKVSVSVYFMLAEWTNSGADMIFPDGFGLYRLRFTSLNSLRSILGSVKYLASTTGGTIAGIPHDLFLTEKEHSDATGAKRRVWIWQAVTRPPQSLRLTPEIFRAVMENGQHQRKLLQLEAPAQETIDTAVIDAPDIDLDDATLESLQNPPCDANYWRGRWHAVVAGTPFAKDEVRHSFIMQHTRNQFSGLSTFLAASTDDEARELIEAVEVGIRSAAETVQTMPDPSPAAVATAQEITAAWERFDALCEEATGLGIKTKPLPDGCDYDTAREWIGKLEKAIASKRAKLAADAGPVDTDAPIEGEVVEPEPTPVERVALPTNPRTLQQAIEEKAEAASHPLDEEGESLFGQMDHVHDLMQAFKEGVDKHDTGGDLQDAPALLAVNEWYLASNRGKAIESLDQVTAEEAKLLIRGITNKAIRVKPVAEVAA